MSVLYHVCRYNSISTIFKINDEGDKIISFFNKAKIESEKFANQLEKDKANIISAYNLHKAITQLNQQSENQDTFIRHFTIETPLTKRDRYTIGEDFVYLQNWFTIIYCKNNPDFIPILEKEEKINSWKLYFLPKEQFNPSEKDSLIQEIITNSLNSQK